MSQRKRCYSNQALEIGTASSISQNHQSVNIQDDAYKTNRGLESGIQSPILYRKKAIDQQKLLKIQEVLLNKCSKIMSEDCKRFRAFNFTGERVFSDCLKFLDTKKEAPKTRAGPIHLRIDKSMQRTSINFKHKAEWNERVRSRAFLQTQSPSVKLDRRQEDVNRMSRDSKGSRGTLVDEHTQNLHIVGSMLDNMSDK